ncbi:MAG: HAMP domain-containing histidine kinase [Clostridia bacterium]|nr:HAMP domain-containing histidine kinase [Clostridia bacterium]MDE6604438.1 HAMP domain-containing histidine kinase [Clostridia bacterium]
MNDKVFKKLQRKFFYVPLAIGWAFIILACLLVFLVSRVQTLTDVENDLLKAAAGPYFQSDNFIYVVEVDNHEPTTYYSPDYFTREEIQAVVKKVTDKKAESGSFNTESKRRYMYISTAVKESGKDATKYTIIDYTKSYNYLQIMSITLTCICIVGMLIIFLFYYYFAKHAIEPVKQSFLRQQELIANASHELKTPLTVVRTNLELIQSDPSSTVEDNQKWIDSAGYQLGRMQSLILDMLELTKYESNKINTQREDLVINDIVEGMTLSFEAICYEKSITLDYTADENIKVSASVAEIEKIVGILLDNAVKYTPQNGKMSLQLQKTRRYAVITLTNTGEGIPQEKIDHIFDRFYKVDSSHKDTGNSFGLGLSIAKSIVDSLKGRIKCESQLGEYTRFTVELPLSALNFLPKNNY